MVQFKMSNLLVEIEEELRIKEKWFTSKSPQFINFKIVFLTSFIQYSSNIPPCCIRVFYECFY